MFQRMLLGWMYFTVFSSHADHAVSMIIQNVSGHDLDTNLQRSRRECVKREACFENSDNFLLGCVCGEPDTVACELDEGYPVHCCGYCCPGDKTLNEIEATSWMTNNSCPCTPTEFVAVPASATEFNRCGPLTVCDPDTEFVVLAPTVNTNRFCHAYTTCTSTEFQAANPTATTDRACVPIAPPCNDATEFQVYAPTSSSDRICLSYVVCDYTTQFEVAPPTPTTDRACLEVSRPCDFATEFQVASPTSTSDRVCIPLSVCKIATQFEVAAQTPTTDRACLQVSPPCNFTTDFKAVSPTSTSDRVCIPLAVCDFATQYAVGTSTPTTDRACLQVSPTCNHTEEFQVASPTPTSDRICTSISICNDATQFLAKQPTETSNRVCNDLTVCNSNNQYASVTATSTSDRQCSLIAEPCDSTTQYQSVAPSSNTNRNCTALTRCSPQHQYQSEPPTPTTDRQCSYLANCSSHNEMEMHAPTPTSNRMCGNSTIVTASNKLNKSSDAGIAIGVIVVLLIFTVAALYLVRQKRTTEEDLRLNEQLLKGERAEKESLFAENMEMKSAWEIDEADLVTQEILASGAMGVVWRATWGHIQVAMKVLKTPVDDDFSPLVSEDFNREVSFMQKIRHPNLLIFYGAGITSKNMAFLVTEYMAKGSLRSVLKSSNSVTLGVEMRQNMALDCARGMRHLHSLGSIHRDLKSDNCLVDDNLRVKVADFGESCLIRSAQNRMNMHMHLLETFDVTANPSMSLTRGVGTPLWMAPELFSQSTQYGPEIDVYSFGIIMWELATLKEPWAEDIKEQGIPFCSALVEAVVAGRRPTIPDSNEFSPTYVALLHKCWAGEPLDRPKFSAIVDTLSPIS